MSKNRRMKTNKSIGFSLSGGGARAISHIGFLKVMEEEGVRASCIAGTSGGAIIAALYAAGLSIDEMLQFVTEGSFMKMYRPTVPLMGLTRIDYLGKLFEKYIPFNTFEDFHIPLSVAATGLGSGQAKIFNSGDFKQAIMASCAIPLVFHPIKIEDELYVDGGLLNNLPTEPLVNHCDLVIGVSSVAKAPFPQKNLTNMIDIGLRIFNIVEAHSVEVKRPACDLIIEAEGLATYNIFNFNLVDELVEIGYQASKAKVGELRELLDRNDVEII